MLGTGAFMCADLFDKSESTHVGSQPIVGMSRVAQEAFKSQPQTGRGNDIVNNRYKKFPRDNSAV